MKHAFQDQDAVYIVMDVALGGDLEFQRIHRFKENVFPENVAKFCAVEVFLGLRYLHSINLLHRDIKVNCVPIPICEFTTCVITACKYAHGAERAHKIDRFWNIGVCRQHK